jgi:4-aminobutyrate aminotransferase-like enzyme
MLQDYESRNITFIDPDGSWPVVWETANGVTVRDADGKKYLDLTAAFGVAAAGHANRAVVAAGRKQMGRLLHAMGDVHPHRLKAQLARELSRLTFERWMPSSTGKSIFCNSGFEAVEAALKTAFLVTGKPGVIAFEGAYHGLGYGALNATHREHFRSPFRPQLREFASFIPFPGQAEIHDLIEVERRVVNLFKTRPVGAVLVEPIQVRGGIHIPPTGFLPLLMQICRKHDALLILDEIYTGLGRTGKWFACEYSGVAPHLVCIGKALTGGFPLSACVGRADVMDRAWPASTGEAIHTSTYLGHPVGCAMASAQIQEIEQLQLVEGSATKGDWLLAALQDLVERVAASGQCPLKFSVRGRGLLAGVEIRTAENLPASEVCLHIVKQLLRRGFILLPEGEFSNVLSFSPPLTITERQLRLCLLALEQELEATR